MLYLYFHMKFHLSDYSLLASCTVNAVREYSWGAEMAMEPSKAVIEYKEEIKALLNTIKTIHRHKVINFSKNLLKHSEILFLLILYLEFMAMILLYSKKIIAKLQKNQFF